MKKVCLSFDFEECDLPRESGVDNLGKPMIGRLERLIASLKSPDVEFVPICDLVKV